MPFVLHKSHEGVTFAADWMDILSVGKKKLM